MQVYAPHPSELKPIIDHEHLVNNSLLAFSLAICKALPARFVFNMCSNGYNYTESLLGLGCSDAIPRTCGREYEKFFV